MPGDRSAPAPCGCRPEHGEHLTGCQCLAFFPIRIEQFYTEGDIKPNEQLNRSFTQAGNQSQNQKLKHQEHLKISFLQIEDKSQAAGCSTSPYSPSPPTASIPQEAVGGRHRGQHRTRPQQEELGQRARGLQALTERQNPRLAQPDTKPASNNFHRDLATEAQPHTWAQSRVREHQQQEGRRRPWKPWGLQAPDQGAGTRGTDPLGVTPPAHGSPRGTDPASSHPPGTGQDFSPSTAANSSSSHKSIQLSPSMGAASTPEHAQCGLIFFQSFDEIADEQRPAAATRCHPCCDPAILEANPPLCEWEHPTPSVAWQALPRCSHTSEGTQPAPGAPRIPGDFRTRI
ncbi:hypothetical protein Anapl_04215 [Anas platyrhynchos]|uniref:Uncharacterized protein n=1 Tax=Anas platyrhynchos TaxID=8839 RepID=R0JFE5_ANAPL|nr:hypothetical protein Anapl_04215 [Anas platyrhynchos]